jgi:tripartite-type tricarboxylate transporter receptor subunit TctC
LAIIPSTGHCGIVGPAIQPPIQGLKSGSLKEWLNLESVLNVMQRNRRHLACTVLAVMLAVLPAGPAWVQPQGTRTIKLVVPYPPGGGLDSMARVLADHIGRTQGHTVMIENRPGANTIIGADAVSRALPDGNTVLVADTNFVITPHLRKLNYDPRTSFSPICHLASSPQVIAVNGASPYRTLADLLAAAHAKPGDLTVATLGQGSLPQLEFAMLGRAAKVDITFVPYPGAAPSVNALLGGHVTATLMSYASMSEQVQAGSLRALATVTLRRMVALPDVPTVAESGYPDYEADLWEGVFVPAKTPKETVAELISWFTQALGDAETGRKLVAQGLVPVGKCGTDFAASINKQYEEFGRFIREANVKVE